MYKKISSNDKRIYLPNDSDEELLDMLKKAEDNFYGIKEKWEQAHADYEASGKQEDLSRSNYYGLFVVHSKETLNAILEEIEERELKYEEV